MYNVFDVLCHEFPLIRQAFLSAIISQYQFSIQAIMNILLICQAHSPTISSQKKLEQINKTSLYIFDMHSCSYFSLYVRTVCTCELILPCTVCALSAEPSHAHTSNKVMVSVRLETAAFTYMVSLLAQWQYGHKLS